jgi:hypothetical protein
VRELREPAFGPPAVLAFPAGKSPFRQKGNGYLGDMRFFDGVVPGGSSAVLAAIPDPVARAFLGQRFRASEWYDALPGGMLEATAARLRGLPFEQHRRQTGAWHAARAIGGIYAALFKLVSSESVALWAPRISSMYFEFGKAETRAAGHSAVDGWWRGLPCELAQSVAYGSAGFCTEALRRTGALEPVVTLHEVETDGTQYGRELVRVRLRMRWR